MIAALLLVFAAACDGTGYYRSDVREYQAEDLAAYNKDSYTERYRLSVDDGTYERYIGGTYRGRTVGSTYRLKLFETGTYKENAPDITFLPKKRYFFDTETLENLGTKHRKPRSGTISDTSLTIGDIEYERKR